MSARVQLKRTKGWRKPEGAVVVARPSKWGNPYTVNGAREAGYEGSDSELRAMCRSAFREWLIGGHQPYIETVRRERMLADIDELRDRDLACWCPLDQPCHADVLMEIANSRAVSDPGGEG